MGGAAVDLGADQDVVPGAIVNAARHAVLLEVSAERNRQDTKWDEQDHGDFVWGAILGEEVGEAHQAALEFEFGDSENPNADLRKELIQVAAVAVAWIECLDRRLS